MDTVKTSLVDEIVSLRHQFHQYPELSNQEFATTEKIKQILTDWNIPIVETDLDTGLLAEIRGNEAGATIALRADIDALPVTEQTNLPYKSKNDGVMHACGHDIHFSSLLGAAYLLNQQKDSLKGTVRLLFQPAEEAGHGGDQVLNKHALDGVQAIAGFHNNPTMPVGQIALDQGPLMAGCYRFVVKIHGNGTHGAQPQKGTDPIVTQAAIISQLQTIVSRNNDPFHAVVVSVTKVNAGKTWNVIPETAIFEGTARTFYEEDTELVKRRFFEIVNNTAQAFGQKAEIDWTTGALPIDNDPEITQVVASGLSQPVVKPVLTMTAEDFATFEAKIPGTFAFIGSNGAKDAADLHDPHYVGSDKTIPVAINYFVETVHSLLNHFNNLEK
ncbi:amidohydrolase [Companilactobacillus sp.]|uniref:amidohydrolase n=1 Tax=Companilactobacillus sp. TaxID=2767905 RepID=UPI00260264A9|nr:amidohydrolase [Companilactobacillus sp.]